MGIYSEEHTELTARLRQARKRAALSQAEVARLIGRSQSYVSKIESGQRQIRLTQLREFARVYQADIASLIDG